ncbi:putative tetratricopeptide-like helical domain superfamily, anaphase-promoting complex subunit 5 [Plasmopara halstedii]
MRKWKVNSYVLSVCLLISEYVRQQQQDAKPGEDLAASLIDESHGQRVPSAISKTSLNALARFLCFEIQHPTIFNTESSGNSGIGFTTLKSLLYRLEINLDNVRDFEQLSWLVVSILTQLESPDAVCDVVENISECVAPLQSTLDEVEDMDDANSAKSTLLRTSLLGIFVRSFLLEVNRLLFDGLSRLLDDVKEYLKQFRKDMETEKYALDVASSPTSQNLWKLGKVDENELLLSPIKSELATLSESSTQSNMVTPLASKFDSEILSEKLLTPEAALEVNDFAVWSNDQLNYVMNDIVRDTKGSQRRQHVEIQSRGEQLRLLRSKMDSSNPNVLFARYLSFLNDRDYQGALDSLHQYHDVLSPRKENDLTSSEVAEMCFRGSGIQYAALNLAGLQILFDHYTAAEESIQEAIRAAQHHGDHICVAFSLAWLICINQKCGRSKKAVLKLIFSCLDRAQELRLPSLQVLAILTEAENVLLRGLIAKSETVQTASQYIPHRIAAHAPAPRPLHIWARLQETIQLIASIGTPASCLPGTRPMMAPQMQADRRSDVDNSGKCGGIGLDWIKSAEALLDTVWKLSGQITVFAAVEWNVYAHFPLAQIFSRIHLLCYKDSASTGEIVQIISQMALSRLTVSKDDSNVYEQALNFLVDVASGDHHNVQNRHLFNNMVYQRSVHHLFFLWALQRGEFTRARYHLEAVQALSPQGKDLPAYLAALFFEALLKTAIGDSVQSLELLKRLESMCSEYGFAYLHAQVLIATSRTRIQASAPHAPFASLNTLLKSIDICTCHHYDLLLAEAHVVMAEVYLAMGKLQDANSLINDQMPLVMEHGSVNLRGECWLLLAKTMMARITCSKEGAKEPDSAAMKVIEMLNTSAAIFASVENLRRLKEISYVQSLVYNHVAIQAEKKGEESTLFVTKREKAAECFIEYSMQLNKAPFSTIEP